jgi:hypothetical protein
MLIGVLNFSAISIIIAYIAFVDAYQMVSSGVHPTQEVYTQE